MTNVRHKEIYHRRLEMARVPELDSSCRSIEAVPASDVKVGYNTLDKIVQELDPYTIINL